MRISKVVLAVLFFCVSGFVSGAVTINVPGDHSSIQGGINAAVSGDTVSVGAGTYTENIFLKDGVSVIGAGYDVCTIDGGGMGSVVEAYVTGTDAVLEGFTITNGNNNPGGGGIYCGGGTPTIRSCWIAGNISRYEGGGIRCDGGTPVIESCIITDNESTQKNIGGIYLRAE